MARLKFLFVAALTAGLGAYYLQHLAQATDARSRQQADERLHGAPAAVAAVLREDGVQALANLRAILQGAAVAQAMDDQGKPTAEALEAVRTAIEKVLPPDSERPILVVVSARGVSGRYRLGQSNRFDTDLKAFPALTEPGSLPRSGVGVLDGEPARFAITQFEDTKVEDTKTAGLVALGFPLDDSFAKKLQAAAGGVDVVVLRTDKVVGSTLAPSERQALQAAAGSAKGSFGFGALAGESFSLAGVLKLPLFVEGHRYRAMALPALPGAPADLRVLLATRTQENYLALAEDQKLALGGLSLLVAVCLLLMLFSGNPARGLPEVVSAVEKITQGAREMRAPTAKMGPLVRRAAVAINTLAGQAEAAGKLQPAGPSFAEQLGIKPTRSTGSMPPVPAAALAEPSPFLAESAPLPTAAAGLADVDSFLSGGLAPAAATLPPSTLPPAPPSSPSTLPAVARATSMSQAPQNAPPTPAPVTLPQKPKFELPKYDAPAPQYQPPQYQAPDDNEFGHDQTVIAQTPEALIRATQRNPSFPGGFPQAAPSSPPPAPSGLGAVPLPPPAAANSDEAHYQQIFKEFVATREKCHEPADGLTYEKFAQKLRKNQEQLVQKYACRTVRFQVYVKEGKAALKATPVR